jgi:hypothetical protein
MKNIISVLTVLVLIIVTSCSTSGILVIKDGVTEIPDGKYKSKKLSSVTIPDSVKRIGNLAFLLNNLTSISIPNGVMVIGFAAFGGNELTSIIIPSSITEICDYAFDSNKMTNLIIPDSVTIIGKHAFANNPLKSVTVTLNEKTNIAGNAFGTNINFNRFFLANSNKSGIYSWQDNNYYYNGEIIPFSAVVAYEQGELQKARELTESVRVQERERAEKIRRENSFILVIWSTNRFTGGSQNSGTLISRIDDKPISNYFFAHAGSQLERDVGIQSEWYLLSPGMHILEVRYKEEKMTITSDEIKTTITTTTTTGNGAITFNFEANKAYRLEEKVVGEKIQFNIVETRVP